ncbi:MULTISPECIES: hypothetical protein [unclassified Leeuwenhoekiella]|uniref:hypothetical protein n=1 Tax=unclassified Leeuwenhoekiella TaxID=2615029 RepID=UPI0025C1EF1C|nr:MULTISPECIES: hypothetical protein [unclassified Leeuwenhoekiella]
MNQTKLKLEDFSFEKLEERKEFTFYYSHDSGCAKTHSSCDPCSPPPSCPPPPPPPCGGTPT